MDMESSISDATIERIALYSRPIENLMEKGVKVVSSEKLAEMCKVNPAQVRKDLSYFGEFGVRGVGYDVRDLLGEIKKILVSDREWRLGIVGLGNLRVALLQLSNDLQVIAREMLGADLLGKLLSDSGEQVIPGQLLVDYTHLSGVVLKGVEGCL